MKKLLSLLFLPALALADTAQNFGRIPFGSDLPGPDAAISTTDFTAATTVRAWCFQTNIGETTSKVKFSIGAVTGTVTLSTAICPSTSGLPNLGTISAGVFPNCLETKTLTPTASAINEITGFTTALTAGTRYCRIVYNATGTPASNHFVLNTVRGLGAVDGSSTNNTSLSGGVTTWGYMYMESSDTGGTWNPSGNNPIPAMGHMEEFASGDNYGLIVSNATNSANTVYSTRRLGAWFTTPATGPTFNFSTCSMQVSKNGTVPSGGLKYEVYTGASPTMGSPACFTRTLPAANYTNAGNWTPIDFATNCAVPPNTIVRLMAAVGDTASGSSGNEFKAAEFTVDNSAGAKAQFPFGGMKEAYYNGTSLSDDDTKVIPFKCWLDTATPYTVPASGVSAARIQGGM